MRFGHLISSIKKTIMEGQTIRSQPTSTPLNGGVKPNPKKPKAVKPVLPPTGAIWGGGHKKINEQTLIETIKKLAKKKNSKCDKEENGDSPKGAPEGFELNPEINSSIQNR